VTAIPPPDDLAAHLLGIYRTAPPGRQAVVDQYAAHLRASLGRLGLPVTPPTTPGAVHRPGGRGDRGRAAPDPPECVGGR
jgi:hypothetical protein